MGEEEPDAAEKSGKSGTVDSVAAEIVTVVPGKVVEETSPTGISGLKDVQKIADGDGKQGFYSQGKDRTPQASSAEPVSEVQGGDKIGKELYHENQEVEQKAEIRDDEPVVMVVDQEALALALGNPSGEVTGGSSVAPKHNDPEMGGSLSDRSVEVASQTVPDERNMVNDAVLGLSTAQVTPSSIPPLSSCSTPPLPAGTCKPEPVSRPGSEELDLASKLGNDADSSAYDDLPPLDKLQKDTLSIGGECLDDSVHSRPAHLVGDSAADIPVSAGSEELVLGTDHELLQPASTPVGIKSVKSAARLQFYSPRRSLGATPKEKAHVAELSLRHVLSDPISCSLMDDAMVAQCGHSFGHASLQRVMETNICTSCGATVPQGSLVPNLALRAAVIAFRREDQLSHPNTPKGSKRRRDQQELSDGTDAKRLNRTQDTPTTPVESFSLDGSRPRGVQFPFVVSDRVLIKGNKRTPERFVGREAIITTQCLNGWYMVRTLDNGESVRLQYRSLQKLGDTHVSPDSEGATLSPPGNFSTSPIAYLKESPERSPFSMHRETRAASSAPPVPSKGPRTEYQKKMSRGSRKTVSRPNDPVGPTSSPSGISSNSSREVSADQVTGSKSIGEHSKLLADLIDEGRDAVGEQKPIQAGAELPDGGREHDLGGESFTTRSKRSVVHSRGPAFTAGALHADPDPYRKVYTSGSRRRAFVGDGPHSLVSEQTPALLPDSKPPMKLSDGDHAVQQIQDLDVTTNGHAGASEEKGLQEVVKSKGSGDIIRMMRKDVLKLERMTPWSCLQKSWKLVRNEWRKGVKESCTVVDLSNRVEDFRRSLLLTSAGGMSDEDWEVRIGATKRAEDVELLIPLWGRLYEDVYKWLESKPKAAGSTAIESFHVDPEVQKHFPQLCANGMSPVAFTAAATLATADVVLSDGSKDAEAMVAVMVKQLRQHNRHDLVAIREGLEREKRHIAAKLAQLDCTRLNGSSVVAKEESLEDTTLISNPEAFVTLPTPDCIPLLSQVTSAPIDSTRLGTTVAVTSPMEEDMLKSPAELGMEPAGILKPSDDDSDGGESDAMIHLRDNDGEATDMSDSD